MNIGKVNTRNVYWWLQIGGWFLYILTAFILNQFKGAPINFTLIFSLFIAFTTGILLSHAYRETIIRNHWINLNIFRLLPRVLIATIVLSIIFEAIYYGITYTAFSWGEKIIWVTVFQEFLGWEILLLLWSLIYFIFHIFRNYKNEEIKNLRWEATKNEIELNKLKSQLNPHFIFNAMNSIRALVDENPKKAKLVITKLSNVLRNNLTMGKMKFIPLAEEIILVKDYLSIEKARFEERLQFTINIAPDTENLQVPPMMVQTLVENGIKHGISKIAKGGKISLTTQLINNNLEITIINSGKYLANQKPKSGFGLANTSERLKLLYGNSAGFTIENTPNNEVITILNLPIQTN